MQAVISPSGNYLAYVTADDESWTNTQLVILNLSTSAKVIVGAYPHGFWPQLRWSSDSTHLAFVLFNATLQRPEIYDTSLDGHNISKIVSAPTFTLQSLEGYEDAMYGWDAAGTHIVYYDNALTPHTVYTVPVGGSGTASSSQTLTASQSLAVTGNSLPSTPCNAPLITQNDPSWTSDIMQTAGDTIGNSGCILTSATMLLNYYGQSYTPATLNTCMGNDADPFYWSYLPSCSNGSVGYISEGSFSWSTLDSELSAGHPTIVGVDWLPSSPNYSYRTHYFLVVSGDGSDTPANYLINDPEYAVRHTMQDIVNEGGSLDYVAVYHPTSGTWPACTTGGTVVAPAMPLSVTHVGLNSSGQLEAFGLDGSGDMLHNWEQTASQSTSWQSSWASLGGGGMRHFTVGVNADGHLEIFAAGSDGNMYHIWQTTPGDPTSWTSNNSSPPWQSFGAPSGVNFIRAQPAVGVNYTPNNSSTNGELMLFAIGSDGALYFDPQNGPNGGWSAWSSLGTPPNTYLTTVAVGRNQNGTLEVFGGGADGNLWHDYQKSAGANIPSNWSGWSSLSMPSGVDFVNEQPALGYDVGTGATLSGSQEVFIPGSDGNLWHLWQTAPNSVWSSWTSMGAPSGETFVQGQPAAINDTDGHLDVFLVSSDGKPYEASQASAGSESWGSWLTPSGSIPAGVNFLDEPLSIGSNQDKHLDVVIVGSNQTMWDNYEASGAYQGWTSLGGTFAASVPPPAAAVSHIGYNQDGAMTLYMVGTDGNLWNNFQPSPSGSWSGWTDQHKPNVTGPLGQVTVGENANGTEELFVSASDGGIWLLPQASINAGFGSWVQLGNPVGVNLTSPAIGYNQTGQMTLYAIGSDGSLEDNYQPSPNSGWNGWASLTLPVNGSETVHPLQITVGQNEDGRESLLMSGTDGGIWELRQSTVNGSFGSWVQLGNPVGVSLTHPVVGYNQSGQITLYTLGSDGNIYENFQTAPNSGWYGWTELTNPGGSVTALSVGRSATGLEVLFAEISSGTISELPQVAANAGFGTWSSLSMPTSAPMSMLDVGENLNETLQLVGIGSDSSLWYDAQQTGSDLGSWTGWTTLDVTYGVPKAPFAAVKHVGYNQDGRMTLAAKGTDGNLYYVYQTAVNGPWSTTWTNEHTPTSVAMEQFTIAQNPNGDQDLIISGSDGNLWQLVQTAPNAGFGSWNSIGKPSGVNLSFPTCGYNQDGAITLYALGSDGNIWYTYQTDSNGTWSGTWTNVQKPSGVTVAQLTAGYSPNGDQVLLISGSDGNFYQLPQTAPNASLGSWASLGAPSGITMSSPVVAYNQDGAITLYGTGSDGNLYYLYQTDLNGTWATTWTNVGKPSGETASKVVATQLGDGREDVLMTTTDGSVWQLPQIAINASLGSWSSVGKPASATLSTLDAGENVNGTEQLLGVGSDGAMWEDPEQTDGSSNAWLGWSSLGGSLVP